MADGAEVRAVNRAIDELRMRVREARAAFGDAPALQRLINDVERLEIDVRELDAVAATATVRASAPAMPRITIPDTPADPAMWVDADDEGIGGYHGPLK
jgi:hypothetical protein